MPIIRMALRAWKLEIHGPRRLCDAHLEVQGRCIWVTAGASWRTCCDHGTWRLRAASTTVGDAQTLECKVENAAVASRDRARNRASSPVER